MFIYRELGKLEQNGFPLEISTFQVTKNTLVKKVEKGIETDVVT